MGRATVIRGDARNLPLPDRSVDLICTSPPYYGLRDYRDGDTSLEGQIGAEPTPWEYLDALWDCTREWMRVLKPEGSLWLNLGDKYSSPGGQTDTTAAVRLQGHPAVRNQGRPQRSTGGVREKSLMGLPWRYAIGCIDQLGLILRAEVIWDKPNGLPESVTDRVRRSHEHWFHFTLEPQYYSAVDEIRLPHIHGGRGATWNERKARGESPRYGDLGGGASGGSPGPRAGHPLGALPLSVWEVATQPLKVPDHLGIDHYAAFPMEFPRRIIRGWSPPGICVECGEGRRPVADVQKTYAPRPSRVTALTQAHGQDGREGSRPSSIAHITDYACACPEPTAPTRPAVVLDPFGGTGTTALLADVLGRHGISVDRSADYCRIAQWRTTDPGERARAMQVPKPTPVPETQPSLFDDEVVA